MDFRAIEDDIGKAHRACLVALRDPVG